MNPLAQTPNVRKEKRKASPGSTPQDQPAKKSVPDGEDKHKFPPQETVVVTSTNKKFLTLTIRSILTLIFTSLGGNVNSDTVKVKRIFKSKTLLIHSPVDRIRSKLLSLEKLGDYGIKVEKYDPEFKARKNRENNTKKENENKNAKVKINKVIKAPVHESIQTLKDQEKIISENCGFKVQLKKLNENALIATFDAEHTGQKEFQLNNGIKYALTTFIPKPKICTKCGKLGHFTSKCKSVTSTCLNCAGNHETKACRSRKLKCVNCKGNHSSLDKECPNYIFHAKVNEIMAKENLKLREAIKKVKTPLASKKQVNTLSHADNTPVNNLTSGQQSTQVPTGVTNLPNTPVQAGNSHSRVFKTPRVSKVNLTPLPLSK